MNRRMTKPTKWHVRPAKTRISLGIHPIWSVFAVRSMFSYGSKLSSCGQRILWGWSEPSLGEHVTLLVLSWGGLYMDFKEKWCEPQKQAYWYHSFVLSERRVTVLQLEKLPYPEKGRLSGKNFRPFGPVVGQTMTKKVKCRLHRSVIHSNSLLTPKVLWGQYNNSKWIAPWRNGYSFNC